MNPDRGPRPISHLRVFSISLTLVVLSLCGFLFGVRMEAVAPATGVVTARDVRQVRPLIDGLVEPGWYEGEITTGDSRPVPVRLDHHGDGTTDPAAGKLFVIRQQAWIEGGRRVPVENLRFRRLQAGDELWPGQVLAMLRDDDLRWQLKTVEEQLKDLESGPTRFALGRERERLRERLAHTVMQAPAGTDPWLVLEVVAAPLASVKAGDLIATIVPVDPQTHRPRELIARLDVDETHWGDLAAGQDVRIYSNVFNHRLYGCAVARIESLQPQGEPASGGERHFHARAPIIEAPFNLPLGSSFKAEVVVGRKLVYRIILEH